MTSERNVSSHSESEILNPGCILAEHNGAHDMRRLPGPICPHESPMCPCVTGHYWSQYCTGAEDLVKPIIREALCINGKLKRNMAEKPPIIGRRSQSLCPQSGGLQIWGTWCYNVTNIRDRRDKDWGIKMSVPGTRIFWAALFNSPHSANWRTELNWDMGWGWVGSIDILIFETQGNGMSDSYSSPSRDVIRAITLLYCQDSPLSNVGAGADCFRIEVKPLLAPTLSRSEPSNGDKWQFNLRQNPSLTIENNPTTFEWSVKLHNFRV